MTLPRTHTKQCPVCGTAFEGVAVRIYCSAACADRAATERSKARMRAGAPSSVRVPLPTDPVPIGGQGPIWGATWARLASAEATESIDGLTALELARRIDLRSTPPGTVPALARALHEILERVAPAREHEDDGVADLAGRRWAKLA